jgi:ribosomal protein L37AE/L43A
MNVFRERIKSYNSFIKDGKVKHNEDWYRGQVEHYKRILSLIKEDKLTTRFFNSLSHRDKWDVSKLLKNVTWHCAFCGQEQELQRPFMGEICCSNCGNTLTYRTNGGQSNPFNYIFKKKKTLTRPLKSDN